eukprot:jgi/Chlat1/2036/Chrsp159S02326
MAGRQWEALLLQSSDLAAAAAVRKDAAPALGTTGIPLIERSIDQLEALSRQLRERSGPAGDADTSKSIAAIRLLAREGVDADRLSRELRSFELRASVDDVFPIDHTPTSLPEYLKHLHQATLLTAIHQAQALANERFEAFMANAMRRDYDKEKRQFLQSFGRLLASPSVPTSTSVQAVPTPGAAPTKAAAYAQAVKSLNQAVTSGQQFEVVSSCLEASTMGVSRDQAAALTNVWRLLDCLVNGADSVLGQVRGARSFLEQGHVQYIMDVINSHPSQARLGGATSTIDRIKAFLRVKLRDQGPLDFDAESSNARSPPIDTTWYQIFYCLRSGYYDDALQVAKNSRALSAARGGASFSAALAEWVHSKGVVSSATAEPVAAECERMLRTADRQGRPSYERIKLLVYAIVAGHWRAVDRLQVDTPSLFNTIQDFMWVRLALIQKDESTSPNDYTIKDLQFYLRQYPPSHYNKNGLDPLLYGQVLLLSLQYGDFLAYLARDRVTEPYRVDAVHFAIALSHYGLLRSRTDAMDESIDVAMFTELLVSPGGLQLLPSGDRPGEIERFIKDRNDLRKIILDAAYHCETKSMFDEAIELYHRAGAPILALAVVNRKLADAIQVGGGTLAIKPLPPQEWQQLKRRGDELRQDIEFASSRMKEADYNDGRLQIQTFEQLWHLYEFARAYSERRLSDSLALLEKLSFLPLETQRVELCRAGLESLDQSVASKLPAVLLVAAELLFKQHRSGVPAKEQLRALMQFATGLQLPPFVVQRLAEINGMVA